MTQVGVVWIFVSNMSVLKDEKGSKSATSSSTGRPRSVQFPDGYQPPCQIQAKEAVSALNR
jgi:hypothetical protein